MKKFTEFLTESGYSSVITDKFGKRGFNGCIAWFKVKNAGIKDRCVFELESGASQIWKKEDLKQVYRIYHNDDPKNKVNGSSLVKIDAKAGVVWFLDDEKMRDDDTKLIWKQKYQIKEMSVFEKKFYTDQ